jgi:hypothetical protein
MLHTFHFTQKDLLYSRKSYFTSTWQVTIERNKNKGAVTARPELHRIFRAALLTQDTLLCDRNNLDYAHLLEYERHLGSHLSESRQLDTAPLAQGMQRSPFGLSEPILRPQ